MPSTLMIDTPLMRGLEHALDQGAFRHRLIASNLANVDTPGYRTRDIRPFQGDNKPCPSKVSISRRCHANSMD